jgi:mevalonate kinase
VAIGYNPTLAQVLDHFGIDPSRRGVRLRFGGDLTCVSGIGASAAQVPYF